MGFAQGHWMDAGVMLAELGGKAERNNPTMGAVAKINYSHVDMIDFIIANPGCRLKDIAARYGYTAAWSCNVQASDAWKVAMAARRAEIVDPTLVATVTERFEGIAILSLERLKEKLEKPAVSDNVVLKAVELGAKALGIGGNANPPPPAQADHLAQLANRLIDLQSKIRQGVTIDVKAQEVVQIPG